jgi:hypothetical protein
LKLEAVNVSSLEVGFQPTFGKFAAVLPEFAKINSAAYWDYQRSKVYIRTDKKIRQSIKKSTRTHANLAVDKEANIDGPLVLLCHKLCVAAGTSWEPSHESADEFSPDGGDRLGDVAFGADGCSREAGRLSIGGTLYRW